MRVDDGEHVAAIERLAEPGETSGIAEGAPIEAVDDNDTVPNEPLEDDAEDGGDNGENGENGDADDADDDGGDEPEA
jgi:hypothetical protein